MNTLRYPVTLAVGVAVAISIALRALFIWKEQWLWDRVLPLQMGDITPWARGVVRVRDGAEPYALVLPEVRRRAAGVHPAALSRGTGSELVAQITRVLDDGYKVVVPHDRDWAAPFAEILPRLGNLRVIDTAQYRLYARPLVAQQR
jgi:hypothetical protein